MEQKSSKQVMEELQRPFSVDEIEWRVGSTTKDKSKGMALPYVNNKAIQNRLDDVFGVFGWETEFTDWKNCAAQLCTITVYWEGRAIKKQDGAENTEVSCIKGGLSDSMKRAACQFGIGRFLHKFPREWVKLEGKSIPNDEIAKLKSKYNAFINNKPQKAASAPEGVIQEIPKKIDSSKKQLKSDKESRNSNNSQAQKVFQGNNEQRISRPLADTIKKMIKNKNADKRKLIAYYNVLSIEDMTMTQAADAIGMLNKK